MKAHRDPVGNAHTIAISAISSIIFGAIALLMWANWDLIASVPQQ